MKKVLLTGAAGFIGSHVTEHILKNTDWEIISLVRLNHAGDLRRIMEQDIIKEAGDRIKFVYHDLKYVVPIDQIGEVDYILHLAANSHVDRSITHPMEFAMDNVVGTVNMLEAARKILKKDGMFVNFLTDEVFGPAPDDYDYTEEDRWRPSNPYSASKASQGAFGIAYQNTYGLPLITTYTMNVFGERQHKEKFIPIVINKIRKGERLQIHCSNGKPASRAWIHARNASSAIMFLLEDTPVTVRDKYNITGEVEFNNLDLAMIIANCMDKPLLYDLVDHYSSRPGHDPRSQGRRPGHAVRHQGPAQVRHPRRQPGDFH